MKTPAYYSIDQGREPDFNRQLAESAGDVLTPWGPAGELRSGRLPPGRGTPREEVARSQRERLYGAVVAAVSVRGYESTRVADLLELSGVSRKAFYAHFADKRECFLGAVRALVRAGTEIMLAGYEVPGDWEERARSGLGAFASLLAAQPAAARMCFVEVYAAGEPAIELIDGAFNGFEVVLATALEKTPERAGMPPEMVRALLGGMRKVFHTRLHRGQEAALAAVTPQLADWALAYRPPPRALRHPPAPAPPAAGPDPFTVHDQAERIIRAVATVVARRGYARTTVEEIVAEAACSLTTFYAHFENKEAAVLAALDRGGALMVAAIGPAYRRARSWPVAVRAAIGAMFAFALTEPDFARLGAVEVYAAGRNALEQRDAVMEALTPLLAPGYERNPEASPLAAEAIGGAIYALTYDQVRAGGPSSLPEIGPLATYIALAPFLGPDGACRVANGEGRIG
ncbi:MAG TPA: TetR/AcrR family transcriptional regulator [Solirubrobacterales bacterium]|nr:TetR/AcrR family transcriptional regulator [Solirubrobacterales bacterium]